MLRGKEEKITFSKGLGTECRKLGISAKEKAFADLLALGWKDKDAYLISGLYNPVYNLEMNKKNMNALLSQDKDFMDYLTFIKHDGERTNLIRINDKTWTNQPFVANINEVHRP